jgi:ferredoxin-NADP reductase
MAPRTPIVWRSAAVLEIRDEAVYAKTIRLEVPGWPGHVAGQHVDLRLTAEDGYQAQRSYSIASPPEAEALELSVERIEDGEVSPYLTEELRPGDQFELRGPIGGYFNWRVEDGGPLILLAGGSGVVPLMAMLRHREARHSDVEVRLLVSARSLEELFYRDELFSLATRSGVQVEITLTRRQPDVWRGGRRRVDEDMLRALGPPPAARPRTFVCGPTAFVERVADLLVGLGHPAQDIRTERFGPSGP